MTDRSGNPRGEALIAQMSGVTVAREYGSGGGEIAARLAKRLDWHLIDHQIIAEAARALQMSEDEAAEFDEYSPSVLERILMSMTTVQPTTPIAVPPYGAEPREYHEVLVRFLQAAAAERHVVMVGRGAQLLFNDRRDFLHALVVAPFDLRVDYVMRREGIDRAAAAERVKTRDRDRIRFIEAFYHHDPLDPHVYDLTINTAALELDAAVDLIARALAEKASRLRLSPEDLGPGAGLTRYPGAPADFSMPQRPK